MSVPAPNPDEPSVDLKNRWLAGFLALLIPGLGHFYQGRNFKAAIYCVCILGLFFTGQALGEWKVVYLGDSDSGGRIAAGRGVVKRLLQGYAAQFPVGVFAWPAIVQNNRYQQPDDVHPSELDEPFEAPFSGGLWIDTFNGPRPLVEVTGTVRFEPFKGTVRGTFVGTTEAGEPIEIALHGIRELDRRVSANEERTLIANIEALPAGIENPGNSKPYLAGGIPRPFWDRYQVPLGDQGEDALTAKLGGRLEIAYVFTWIAGLLNVLAIWDAIDGPAYGYRDEPNKNRKGRRGKDEDDAASEPGRKLEPAGRTA